MSRESELTIGFALAILAISPPSVIPSRVGAHATKILEEGSRRPRASSQRRYEKDEAISRIALKAAWNSATRMRNPRMFAATI
jgi:hypothetical protein